MQGHLSPEDVSFGQLLLIGLVSALCSMGAGPIPSAGLVLLVLILEAVVWSTLPFPSSVHDILTG